MSFFGIDIYTHLGMLFVRLLDLSELGYNIKISDSAIQIGDKILTKAHKQWTLDEIEKATRLATPINMSHQNE